MERPVIGVSCGRTEDLARACLNMAYLTAVAQAGGVPLILAPLEYGTPEEATSQAAALVQRVDGILLSGGDDVDPRYYQEEPDPKLGWVDPDRDALEIALAREALKTGRPLLAICRGLQVLNVAAGGDLYQDLGGVGSLQHDQRAPRWHATHQVSVRAGSTLARLLGGEGQEALTIRVNSFHHQAIRRVAPGFRVVAEASDGLVEAIELDDSPGFCLGVQWHPEHLVGRMAAQRGLFRGLVAAAAATARTAAVPG